MKDYQKKIKEYDVAKTVFIEHQWGQNAASLYNQVAKAWDEIPVGGKVVITSNKKLGIKSATTFFKKQGLICEIVGKRADGLRLVECEKTKDESLEFLQTIQRAKFDFHDKQYEVNIGDSIFSKTGLDTGTRFLLESFLNQAIDLDNKEVADFGTGWGAISLILINEFPKVKITAYEKDEASVRATKENLKAYQNFSIKLVDLSQIISSKGKFDYIISNPPFHVTAEERQKIFQNAFNVLKKTGKMFLVVEHSFERRFTKTAQEFFEVVKIAENSEYAVLECAK